MGPAYIEGCDITVAKAEKQGLDIAHMTADISKSGYRVPYLVDMLPTTTTASRIHHFGLHRTLDGFDVLASHPYLVLAWFRE